MTDAAEDLRDWEEERQLMRWEHKKGVCGGWDALCLWCNPFDEDAKENGNERQ